MCVKIDGEPEPERGVKVIPTSERADDAAQDGRKRWTPCVGLGDLLFWLQIKSEALATSQQLASERIPSRT